MKVLYCSVLYDDNKRNYTYYETYHYYHYYYHYQLPLPLQLLQLQYYYDDDDYSYYNGDDNVNCDHNYCNFQFLFNQPTFLLVFCPPRALPQRYVWCSS